MSSNWGEVAEKIQKLSGLSDSVTRPQILNKPFFSDPQLEHQVFDLGKNWLVHEYLERLNLPMRKTGLWPLFGTEMIKFTPRQGGMVYFDQGVTNIKDVGADVKMPLLPFSDGIYAPLTMTKVAYDQSGALGICVVEPRAILPAGQSRGRIVMESSTLKWINKELKDRQRVLLPDILLKYQPGSLKVTKKDIKIFDDNNVFYTVVNIAGNPVLFNRVNESGSEGEVSLVRFSDGKILLVDQLRHLTGGRERAAVRGWSKTKLNYLQELVAISGIDISGKPKILRHTAYQSRFTDFVKVNLNTVIFENESKNTSSNGLFISETGVESAQTVLLNDHELWQQIQSGIIWDAHTIYIAALTWLKLGLIKITMEGEGKGLVLEKRAWASGLEGYDLPRIPVASGQKITELMPDCGSKRIFNPVEIIGVSALPKPRKYVYQSVSEVLQNFSAGGYDLLTGAGLIVGLIHTGLISLNSE